jgi:DNA-directed RNA polymerase specialized sigma subunit
MGKKKIVTVITQQRAYVSREVKEEVIDNNGENITAAVSQPKPKMPTNSEIATMLGISKRQVAKMRRENTLQKVLEKLGITS